VKKTTQEAKPMKPTRKLAKPKPPSAPGTPAAADGIREGPGGNNGAWAGLGSDGVAAAAAGQPRGVVAYAVTITRDGPCVQNCFLFLSTTICCLEYATLNVQKTMPWAHFFRFLTFLFAPLCYQATAAQS
jgi:hypothetical protein